MVVERVSNPDPVAAQPATQADRVRAIVKFAMIEAAGILALMAFLMGYFVFGWFLPDRPMIVVAAIALFAFYVSFAFWASGLLATLMGRTDAGR